ncbi:MAG: hypothetical protein Q8O94_03000 [bacterium]|nr:hypothetical protein [bacterium]
MNFEIPDQLKEIVGDIDIESMLERLLSSGLVAALFLGNPDAKRLLRRFLSSEQMAEFTKLCAMEIREKEARGEKLQKLPMLPHFKKDESK